MDVVSGMHDFLSEDNELADRLEESYERTTEQSPKDVRYHRVLAWVRNPRGDFAGQVDGTN